MQGKWAHTLGLTLVLTGVNCFAKVSLEFPIGKMGMVFSTLGDFVESQHKIWLIAGLQLFLFGLLRVNFSTIFHL
jgi:uncharacterized membrane protein YhhN